MSPSSSRSWPSFVRFALSTALAIVSGCVGEAGGDTYTFPVAAAGPENATPGLVCPASAGWTVTLSQASLHVAAIYLNQSVPVSGGQATSCVQPGTYVAEQTSARDVDLLSAAPQLFPSPGRGLAPPAAQVGEVWLSRGAIDAVPSSSPPEPILVVAGTATATGGGASLPFSAQVTLESNYQTSNQLAGGDPICKKRIVSLIPAMVTLASQGGLLLRIDPCRFFLGVDFSRVPVDATSGVATFSDDPTASSYALSGAYLYGNLHSSSPYSFSWSPTLSPP